MVSYSIVQYLKSDLMRQLDSHISDFMDSLIEETASLDPAPVAAVFSPPLSDKERSKLRYYVLYVITVHVDKPSPHKIDIFSGHYLFSFRHFRPPHGEGKQFVSRRSLLE